MDVIRAKCQHDLDLVKLKNAGILADLARDVVGQCRLDVAASGENLDNSHSEAVNRAAPPPFDEGRRAR